MTEKTGTRLRAPGDLRRYITKILCRMEKLPDKEIQEKAGQISKLGDTWLRAWEKELENEKIKKLEMEICHWRFKSAQFRRDKNAHLHSFWF